MFGRDDRQDMITGGIDLGGTKIEARLFDADWQVVQSKRVPTPKGSLSGVS
jgi:N-acetylglucosamine kinase